MRIAILCSLVLCTAAQAQVGPTFKFTNTTLATIAVPTIGQTIYVVPFGVLDLTSSWRQYDTASLISGLTPWLNTGVLHSVTSNPIGDLLVVSTPPGALAVNQSGQTTQSGASTSQYPDGGRGTSLTPTGIKGTGSPGSLGLGANVTVGLGTAMPGYVLWPTNGSPWAASDYVMCLADQNENCLNSFIIFGNGQVQGADATGPHQFATLEQVQAFVVLPDAGGSEYDFFRIDGGALGPFGLTMADAGTAFNVSGKGDVLVNNCMHIEEGTGGSSNLDLCYSPNYGPLAGYAFITTDAGQIFISTNPDLQDSLVISNDSVSASIAEGQVGWTLSSTGGGQPVFSLSMSPLGFERDGGCAIGIYNNSTSLSCIRETGQVRVQNPVYETDALNEQSIACPNGAYLTTLYPADGGGGPTCNNNFTVDPSGGVQVAGDIASKQGGRPFVSIKNIQGPNNSSEIDVTFESVTEDVFAFLPDGGGSDNQIIRVIRPVDESGSLGIPGYDLLGFSPGGDGGILEDYFDLTNGIVIRSMDEHGDTMQLGTASFAGGNVVIDAAGDTIQLGSSTAREFVATGYDTSLPFVQGGFCAGPNPSNPSNNTVELTPSCSIQPYSNNIVLGVMASYPFNNGLAEYGAVQLTAPVLYVDAGFQGGIGFYVAAQSSNSQMIFGSRPQNRVEAIPQGDGGAGFCEVLSTNLNVGVACLNTDGTVTAAASAVPNEVVIQSQISCPYGTGTVNADGGGGFACIPPTGSGIPVNTAVAREGQTSFTSGSVIVSNTTVTSSSLFFFGSAGGTITNIGQPYVFAITPGVSFQIKSSNILDSSTFNWKFDN